VGKGHRFLVVAAAAAVAVLASGAAIVRGLAQRIADLRRGTATRVLGATLRSLLDRQRLVPWSRGSDGKDDRASGDDVALRAMAQRHDHGGSRGRGSSLGSTGDGPHPRRGAVGHGTRHRLRGGRLGR
jgi:hypothetical protein